MFVFIRTMRVFTAKRTQSGGIVVLNVSNVQDVRLREGERPAFGFALVLSLSSPAPARGTTQESSALHVSQCTGFATLVVIAAASNETVGGATTTRNPCTISASPRPPLPSAFGSECQTPATSA